MSEENTQNEEKIMQDYELGLHLIPTLEDKTQASFDAVRKSVEDTGATVTSSSNPALIPLAYEMVKKIDSKNFKYTEASFGWIKFTLATEAIEDLKEKLDLNDEILRYIILKSSSDAAVSAEEVASFLQGDDEDVVSEDEEEKESVTEHEDKGEEFDKEESEEASDESKEEEEVKEDEIDQKVDEAIDAITEEAEEK